MIFYGDGAHLTPELSTLGKQTWWREPKEKAALENPEYLVSSLGTDG